MDVVVLLLQANSGNARVKAGALLEHDGGLSFVETSEYKENVGRRLQRSSMNRDPAATRQAISHILEFAEVLYAVPDLNLSMLLWNSAECISISDVSAPIARKITDAAKKSGMLIAALRWQASDNISASNLWRRLILTRVVAQGEILGDYEEFPLDEIYDERTLRWRPTRPPWEPATGYFFSYYDDIYPDDTHEHLAIPDDLVETVTPSPIRSPMQRALAGIGSTPVLRISGQDAPDEIATFRTPYPHMQFPDVAAVELKIREYCLQRTHPLQKWKGFLGHGWDGQHPFHSIQLAALISSALLLPFTPHDPRVTADGALQFGAMLAVPSFRSGYLPVETAWVAKPGRQLYLASAYVIRNHGQSLDPTFPFSAPERRSWRSIVNQALEFGAKAPLDDTRAWAGLFVSRRGLGNELCRELVKSGESLGDYRRARLAGRCIQVPLGVAQGWVQASRASACAQVLLGLKGVLSLQATLVD